MPSSSSLGSNPSISSSSLEATAPSNSSSSSDGSPGGCLLKMQGVNFECVEEDKVYGSKQTCASLNGEWVNSCPSGVGKCELESGGVKFVATFYDEEYNPCSSSSLESTTPSSSSSKPSSSSNSTSGSGSEGVCYIPNITPEIDMGMCLEGKTEPITRSECEEFGEEEELIVHFQDSCPSEHQLKCEENEGYIYLYGQAVTNPVITCELF
jgi:hypothetical protein